MPTSEIKEIDGDPQSKIDLLSHLGYDLLDFDLFSSYIIFEESSAERIVRDFLIPWFAPLLHNRLRTVSAHGVADLQTRVIDFTRLFIFLHQTPVYRNKAWVFADGDTAGKKCIEELRNIFKEEWKPDQFQNFSAANFEEYYPAPFAKKYQEIKQIKGNDEKREAKRVLLNELLDWTHKEPEEAKKKFKKSFAEVIAHLQKIESTLLS